METTIQISRDLLETLKRRKMNEKESYEKIIWDLIEDNLEISEETKKEIALARGQYKRGEFKTLEQVKKELKI
jgi:hypothetical protein